MPASVGTPVEPAITTVAALRAAVTDEMNRCPVLDIHTHLYTPAFGGLLLWGVDELLIYHYLIAEVMRTAPSDSSGPITIERFYGLSKPAQADLIWNQLFLERSPLSEACRGVVTTLNRLGLDVRRRDLPSLRQWFAAQKPEAYIDRVLQVAGVRRLIMTNVPFDPAEKPTWDAGYSVGNDPRFQGVLRIDPIMRFWDTPRTGGAARLAEWGYAATPELTAASMDACRKFLHDWCDKTSAVYMACSLPPSFRYPAEAGPNAITTQILRQAVLPVCRERGIPQALMIGSKLAVNPSYGLAGDAVGKSDVESVEALCREFPQNKFLLTMLSRENQHELAVLARKFANLHVFGCWWFLNNPSLVEEITRMRIELLGLSVTPQHSDARVLDQLIYKWDHSRGILGRVLADKYTDLLEAGWHVTRAEISRDVAMLLGGSFEAWLKS